MVAPANSFAAVIADCLSRRRPIVVCTVVRTAEPARYPAGVKVVCPVGEVPRSFGLAEAEAQSLIEKLPLTDPAAAPRVYEVCVGPEGDSLLDVYCELIQPPVQLVVAGAGHIARPMAAMGLALGWSVVVTDDRADYADRSNFPAGTDVICAEFESVWSRLTIDTATAVALVTRGHEHDEACLKALAGTRPFYVGMIGSKRRVRTVMERLHSDGVSAEFLDRVYAPVGLPIGTETPAEIALAVTAEVVAVWRGRGEWANAEKQTYYYGR